MPWEWIILLLILAGLLFFGPKKIPDLMRSLGRSWGEFRRGKVEVDREVRQLESEINVGK